MQKDYKKPHQVKTCQFHPVTSHAAYSPYRLSKTTNRVTVVLQNNVSSYMWYKTKTAFHKMNVTNSQAAWW